MEEKLQTISIIRKRRYQYVKGLLMRIIVACAIFILLFLGNLFTVDIFDYDTKKVVNEIQNNSLMEAIETKLESIFTKNP